MSEAKVFLVGAGPSDARLLTIKAKDAIESADVILYDSLVGDGVLAMIPSGTKLINVGKRAGHAHMSQEDINKTILEEALKGQLVVRLKGGDPFLFGRGGEELELLVDHNIPFEVIPGVTSAISVPAYAGIPVTHRDFCSSVHIITGHLKDDDKPHLDYDALVRLKGTLVFLMGIGALRHICAGLLAAGMRDDMPAAVLEKGTTSEQRRIVSNLSELPEEAKRKGVKTPAIIVVGEVCSLNDKFHWAEDRPLGGARVIVTRPKELASRLSSKLREAGAEVLEIPAIKTVEIEDNSELNDAIKNLISYKWIVFTSQAGVNVFFDALRKNKTDIRAIAGIKIAAIGSATENALASRGLVSELVPEKFDSEHLGIALVKAAAKEDKILIPRARIGSKALTDALDKAGLSYDDIPVYDTVYRNDGVLSLPEIIRNKKVDFIAFTSASTVKGFAAAVENTELLKGLRAVCIGEQTALEAEKLGMKTVISDEITIDSLASKIIELHGQRK